MSFFTPGLSVDRPPCGGQHGVLLTFLTHSAGAAVPPGGACYDASRGPRFRIGVTELTSLGEHRGRLIQQIRDAIGKLPAG